MDVVGAVQNTFTLESGNTPQGGVFLDARAAVGWSTLVLESSDGLGAAGPWSLLATIAIIVRAWVGRIRRIRITRT